MSLPTVDDLKVHLNITTGQHDAELVDMLEAAADVAERIVGPLTGGPVTETHYAVTSPTLLLRQMPASAVSGVTIGSYEYAASDVVLDPVAGQLRLAAGGYFYGDVTVTYTAGRDVVSASVRLAILIIAAHLWETQRGTTPTALALQDPNGGFDAGPIGAGYAIPNRARELLATASRSIA